MTLVSVSLRWKTKSPWKCVNYGIKNHWGLLPRNLEHTMSTDHRNNSLLKTHSYSTRQKNLKNRPEINSTSVP